MTTLVTLEVQSPGGNDSVSHVHARYCIVNYQRNRIRTFSIYMGETVIPAELLVRNLFSLKPDTFYSEIYWYCTANHRKNRIMALEPDTFYSKLYWRCTVNYRKNRIMALEPDTFYSKLCWRCTVNYRKNWIMTFFFSIGKTVVPAEFLVRNRFPLKPGTCYSDLTHVNYSESPFPFWYSSENGRKYRINHTCYHPRKKSKYG